MMVSALSVFLRGSKRTRLLRHGIAGHTVEMVDDSWMAKPCGVSSRCARLRCPPAFGVCARAGRADKKRPIATDAATSVVFARVMETLQECDGIVVSLARACCRAASTGLTSRAARDARDRWRRRPA